MHTFYDNSYDKDTDMFMSAMKRIHEDSSLYQQYIKLSSIPVWKERFDDFLRGTKTLPLLYDPFFKAIFNADTHRDRLSELSSESSIFISSRTDIMLFFRFAYATIHKA